MKAVKHKLTAQVQKELHTIAKQLPVMAKFKADGSPDYRRMTVDYDFMIKHNVKVKDDKGNSIDPIPGGQYLAPVLQYVNHYEILVPIFREDGMDGVNLYIREVKDRHAERLQEIVDNHRKQKRENNFFRKLFRSVGNMFKPHEKRSNSNNPS